MSSKHKQYTKQCPFEHFQFVHHSEGEEEKLYWENAPCGNWMPEEQDICDTCVLRKWGLDPVGRFDSDDHRCMGTEYYDKEAVIAALRKAEKGDSDGGKS